MRLKLVINIVVWMAIGHKGWGGDHGEDHGEDGGEDGFEVGEDDVEVG